MWLGDLFFFLFWSFLFVCFKTVSLVLFWIFIENEETKETKVL